MKEIKVILLERKEIENIISKSYNIKYKLSNKKLNEHYCHLFNIYKEELDDFEKEYLNNIKTCPFYILLIDLVNKNILQPSNYLLNIY